MKIEIKHWLRGTVLFAHEAESNTIKLTLEAGVKAKADLRDADLRDADLRDADLRDADLRDADLRGADLRDADLRDADLRDADLRDADLRGADLRGAVLSGAVLSGAVLSGAVLSGAVLSGADLSGAVLSGAVLSGADLSGAVLSGAVLSGAVLSGAVLSGADLPYIPKIDDLDGKILAAINTQGCSLEMETWHTCETSHCRAGWAIHLSGAVGKTLESIYGSSAAGALIYATCYPGMKIPNFYAGNEEAMADIKSRAKLATKTKTAAVSK